MKQDRKQLKEWIEKQVRFYAPFLGIELQEFYVMFGEKTEYLAISCTFPYLDPNIYFSDSAVKEWKDGELKKDRVLHELCHTITDPLYTKARKRFITESEIEDERERLTDKIAMIIRNLT